MDRLQSIQHIKGNNLTIAGGSVAAIPNAGVLLPGELAINFNEKDPTIIMGSVVNSGITSTSVSATTHVSEFKSKKWLETYILGTANTSEVKTLKYISDTLGLLVGNDADAVVNTWEEIKTFLSSIPSGETYTLMSLLNNKASGELTVNNTTKLYDNISITATSSSVNGIPYAQLKVNVGAVTPSVSGTWNTGFTTYTASSWSDNSNTTLRAAKLSDVRDFYDKFNKMFYLDEANNAIRVNYDLYGVGEISAYGAGTGSTGGGGGTSYNRLDLWGDYSVDKAGYVLSAYLGNDLNSRLSAIEGNGATSIVVNGSGNAITNVSKVGTTLTFSKGSTFLEGNELITLSGDVTGTGNTAITTSIAASTITGKLLTGYSVGSNSAVSATDSILSAFGKIQGQINAIPGTVTSVGLTLPTGLSAATTTITSSGTFAVAFASGYSIPTTAKQTNWDTAYTNNHTHANLSVLSGITSTNVSNWDSAYTSVTAATNLNTVNTIVKRDASGNFSAGTITANLTGTASNASKVTNTLTRGTYLTGSNFDGSAATTWAVDATTTNTASKIVARDGSGNFSAGVITAALAGNASTATKLLSGRTITVSGGGFTSSSVTFDGGENVALSLTLNVVDGGTW